MRVHLLTYSFTLLDESKLALLFIQICSCEWIGNIFRFITFVLGVDLRIDLSSIGGFCFSPCYLLVLFIFFLAFYFSCFAFSLFEKVLVYVSPSPFVPVSLYLYIFRVFPLVHHLHLFLLIKKKFM